jgi:hypothetical protein
MEPLINQHIKEVREHNHGAHGRMVNEGTQESVHFMAMGAGHTKWGNTQGSHHQDVSIWTITPSHDMVDL